MPDTLINNDLIDIGLVQINNSFSGQNYFPEKIDRLSAYQPVERGFERELKKRISYFKNLREKRKSI